MITLNLGEKVINAVIETAAIQSAERCDGGFVLTWRANCAEQIEAHIAEKSADTIRSIIKHGDVVQQSLALLKVGRERNDSPEQIMRVILASFAGQILGINPQQ